MKHLNDITKISGYTAPMVDVIIGGSPCQGLSVAGKRKGLDDERSGLFMEQIRIVKEMRANGKSNGRANHDVCRFLVWENVPGALSSGTPNGEDFRCVLEELARVVEEGVVIPRPPKGKWSNSGCIIGDGYSIAWRIMDSQYWGVPQRRRRIALVADFGGWNAPRIVFGEEPSGGMADGGGQDSSVRHTGADGRQEISPLGQGVSGHTQPRRAKGQATASDAEGSPLADHCVGVDIYNTALTGDKVCAITAGGYTSTGTCPKVIIPAHTFDQGEARANELVVFAVDQGGGKSACNVTENQAPTLTCTHGGEPAVCYEVKPRYIVRRLTPNECEALQGFPQNWTDIGDWIDSKGKKHQSSDAARYKALGNSIALPPWKWVLKRLCACYERDATMASLFSGIGGFDLLWTQINGMGSVLWESEIDDFTSAVCKRHFGDEDTGEKGDLYEFLY